MAGPPNPDELPPLTSACAPEPGLRERKKARLRQELARIALDLHRDQGSEGATVDAICRRAEISQPTFYKYYPSREAILTEHATRGWQDMRRATLGQPNAPLQSRLLSYGLALAEELTRERALWHAVVRSNAYSPARDPNLLAALQAGTSALESAFAEAQDAGEVTPDFAPETLASLLEGLLLRTVVAWTARPAGGAELEMAMVQALEFFWRAAGADQRGGF